MSKMKWMRLLVASALAFGTVACGDDDALPFDAGGTDAGPTDVGPTDVPLLGDVGPGPDAGDPDAGGPDGGDPDAGGPDAGDPDAGFDGGMDAGMDAGPSCDMAVATTEIDAINAITEDGDVSLPITCAYVTYLKPAVAGDDPGFFVQAGPTGPAAFVEIDPDGTVEVGDQISLTATTIDVSGELVIVEAASDLMVLASGTDLTGYVQELSDATDLVTDLGSYISERIAITGIIVGEFGGAGGTFRAAQLSTVGIDDDAELLIRIPQIVVEETGLADGCTVTLDGIMGRFIGSAQATTYDAASLTSITCPAPTVTGASASDATTVTVRFSTELDAASVMASGSQFTFDNGLTASAAVVTGDSVELTTSMQTAATTYTVTVAASVTDSFGTAVDAAMNTAMFDAFNASALHLVINEVDYDQSGSDTADFVEIYNPTDAAVDLADYTLYLVNGNGDTPYNTQVLSGTLPALGYLVVGQADPMVAGSLYIAGPALQNGPDGVALYNTSTGMFVDVFSYEGEVMTDTPSAFSLAEGTVTNLQDSVSGSISRLPNGVDTDEMGTDWAEGTPTPGAANAAP